MSDVLGLGNFVVDLIGKPIERLPAPGQLQMLDALETHVGGNGPNTAGALAKLGGSVAVCGRIGDDFQGRFLLQQLEAWGADVTPVVCDERRQTGMTLVAVNRAGERSFLHDYGANAAFSPADVPWDAPALRGVRHLHLASHFVLPAMDGEPAACVLRRARERGWSTSLDTVWDFSGRGLEALQPCLPYARAGSCRTTRRRGNSPAKTPRRRRPASFASWARTRWWSSSASAAATPPASGAN